MNLLHFHSPWETETGSAGEQPVKGYHGAAHQDDEACRMTEMAWEQPSHALSQLIGLIDRSYLNKTHPKCCGMGPQACVQRSGRSTGEYCKDTCKETAREARLGKASLRRHKCIAGV